MFFTKPNLQFELSAGRYTAKICTTEEEYIQTAKLRYDIFYHDVKPPHLCSGYDFNKFDANSDLIIIKEVDKVIGTYRARCSAFTNEFYSTRSFALDDFFDAVKNKTIVELSRACITPSKRQGGVIIALWRAIKHYLTLCNAEYLIGCVSIFDDCPAIAYGIVEYLKLNNYYLDKYKIKPHEKYIKPVPTDLITGENYLPALFSSYLKMGTRVCSPPAYDPVITGYDYFCVLDLNDLNSNYANKLKGQ